MKGRLPPRGGRKGAIEVYDTARFVTVTQQEGHADNTNEPEQRDHSADGDTDPPDGSARWSSAIRGVLAHEGRVPFLMGV